MSNAYGWVGVDLDGTLALYDTWVNSETIGEPVPAMLALVKGLIKAGREVRIFTARVYPLGRIDPSQIVPMYPDARSQEAMAAAHAIRQWCNKHIGRVLTITCIKDQHCDLIYDDRARQVIKNTGEIVHAGA